MPTYEYRCDACGHKFEKFQSIKAPAIRKCPKCGKLKVHRLISAGGGIIFKGSGFYITDYRDKSYTDKAKSESAASSTDAKKESKTETKSESKSETKSTETKSTETKSTESKSMETKSESKSSKKPKK